MPWADHGISRMQTGKPLMRRHATEGTLIALGTIYADITKVLRVRDEGCDPDSAATNHSTLRGRIAYSGRGARRFAISAGRRGVDEGRKQFGHPASQPQVPTDRNSDRQSESGGRRYGLDCCDPTTRTGRAKLRGSYDAIISKF